MRKTLQKALASLLCLALLLSLAPMALAADTPSAAYRTEQVEENVIVGFQDSGLPLTIDTDYKLALIELQKRFPAQLTILRGGTVSYDREGAVVKVEPAVTESIAVTWKCAEDYDEDLDVFHFVPMLVGPLARGVEAPVITVNVLGELETPPLVMLPEERPLLPPGPSSGQAGGARLPASYNGYEKGVLPPIRNQNPYGTCWVFGTIAAVEADLIHDRKVGTDVDLSELHTIYYTYHDFYDEKGCNAGDNIVLNGAPYLNIGGSPRNAGLTLVNMLGPVNESAVPYEWAATYDPDPADGRTGSYQISNMYCFDLNDRDSVKQAILDHGAVAGSYNSDWAYYSATYNSYFYPNTTGTNHIIALVGWDDNFPKENFRTHTAEGDGAWLVRNSWGTNEYGYGGYFWMSYYDHSMYSTVYGYDVQPRQYSHCYAFDNSPGLYWWRTANNSKVTQRFWVDGGEEIEAVGVFCETGSAKLQFTVKCGTESRTADVVIGTYGYYLVPLSSPLSVIERSEVTVEYDISANMNQVYVNSEGPDAYNGYSGNTGYNVVFNATRGSGMIINGDLKNSDARIKLFTNDAKAPSVPDLVLPDDLVTIGSEAFRGDACRYVKLSDKVTTIGARAFADCPQLAFIHIPASTSKISADAFSGVQGLTILGTAGSYADSYANEHGFAFMPVVAQ